MSANCRRWQGAALLIALALGSCRTQSLLEAERGELPSEERPLVVALEGSTGLETRRLIEAAQLDLADYEANDWRESFVQDAAFAIERELIDHGFLDARVDATIEARPVGRRVAFQVEAGPRTRLAALEFEGVELFEREAVAAEFEFPAASDAADAERWYSELALERGRRGLLGAYLRQGYPNARVEAEVEILEGPARAVLVRVEAGQRRTLGTLAIEFDEPGERSWLQELSKRFAGKPDTPRLRSELRAALERALSDNGYLDAVVTPQGSTVDDAGSVTWRFGVVAGQEVKVDRIVVRALPTPGDEERPLKTLSAFVEDRLTLGPGDVASTDARDESFERLYTTGLFSRVELSFEPSREERRDLIVGLAELPSQEVFLEPGYGSYERLRLRAGWGESNLFGTGRALRVEGLLAQRARRAEIGVSDPSLFGDQISGDLAVRYDERELPSFTTAEWGARLTTNRVLTESIQLSASYDWRRTDVLDATLDPLEDPDLAEALDTVDISSILIGPRYDTRDRLFVPQRGAFLRLGLEWASPLIGSQVDFLKPTLAASSFLLLDPERSSVLALSFQGGVIVPLGATNVIPLSERFFLGGSTSVRAFENNELGPEDASGGSVGGEVFGFASIELRQQLVGGLHGGVFYDVGTVLRQLGDLRDPYGLRGGPGVGLRYLLPVGPLRLDLGYNVDPLPDESDLVLHVAVGMSF